MGKRPKKKKTKHGHLRSHLSGSPEQYNKRVRQSLIDSKDESYIERNPRNECESLMFSIILIPNASLQQ